MAGESVPSQAVNWQAAMVDQNKKDKRSWSNKQERETVLGILTEKEREGETQKDKNLRGHGNEEARTKLKKNKTKMN